MMVPAYVFYLALVIGVPALGFLIERLLRLQLRKHLAPDAVQRAASHVIYCGTLWSFFFLYGYFYPGPHWVSTLAFIALALGTPIFTLFNLIGLARMRLNHPAKRMFALLCVLHLIGVAAMWIEKNQQLKLW